MIVAPDGEVHRVAHVAVQAADDELLGRRDGGVSRCPRRRSARRPCETNARHDQERAEELQQQRGSAVSQPVRLLDDAGDDPGRDGAGRARSRAQREPR